MNGWLRLALLLAGSVIGAHALAAPPLPSGPVPVQELVYARAFDLDQGFAYDWRQERPLVRRGTLLVVQVDPDLAYPRQTAEPVLYVGTQTAMRLNVGYPSGYLVALVPGDMELDAEATRIWFGAPALPESVTQATIAAQHARAVAAGIAPIPRAQVAAAYARGGAPLSRRTLAALLADAAALVERYAPDEAAVAGALRAQE